MNRRPFLIRSVTALSLCLAVVNTFTAQERAEGSTPGAAADFGVQQDRLAREILDPFRSLALQASTEERILSNNARRLFQL